MSAVAVVRLRPTREKRKDGVGGFSADDRRQLFPRRAPHTGEAAERGHVSNGKKRKGLAGLGGLGIAIGTLLLKIKTVLLFLLNLKWLALFGKFGFAGITAIISVVAYSFLFGWPFAIGLVALLFLHEMGHAIVMKLKGMPVGGMIFIPMLV